MFKKIDIEDLPSREKMRPRSVWVGENRHRQNLTRKVLKSYIGKTFDEFYSHICNPPKGKEKLYATVRENVDGGWIFLKTHEVEEIDSYRYSYRCFYLENGIIRYQKPQSYKWKKPGPKYIKIDDMYVTTIDGIWYELTFKDIDVDNLHSRYIRDAVLGWSSASDTWIHWSRPMYCSKKRQLSKREKRKCVSLLNE